MSYEEDKKRIIENTSEEVFELMEKLGFIPNFSLEYSVKCTAFIKTSKGREPQFDFYFDGCKTAADVMRVIYEKFTAIGKNQKINEFKKMMEPVREDHSMRDIKKREL